MTGPTLVWFRRDLRLADHPALTRAAEEGEVVPVFVLDPALEDTGRVRRDRLAGSLRALSEGTGGALRVEHGDPAEVLVELSAALGVRRVHVSTETTPFGRRRDDRVRRGLTRVGAELVGTGSPYAVTPGRVVNGSGGPYRVFTPFGRAWRAHGWRPPLPEPEVRWHGTGGGAGWDELPQEPASGPGDEPAGEAAALERWQRFLAEDLAGYASARDRPDLDSTSRMSVPLKYGEVHPRTLLADLARLPLGEDGERFVTELAWREFYADVLWHDPGSAWTDWRDNLPIEYDEADDLFEAWCTGTTGYPFVDAGMRQLLAEGWMHNRVRMVTASFLVKDLHQWWPRGARHFLTHLRDGDVASNNHGWQWVAGTGTDAAPYFRVFNPVTQGKRFDPDGDYVRRWVPELAHLPGPAAHEPWKHRQGYEADYPLRLVDHDEERRDALARYALARDALARDAGESS